MTDPVTGYVLAGGKSSRMGRNKALVELGGVPLVAIAMAKLRAVCSEVFILSGQTELAGFGSLVPDLHPGCGPLAGIEAGLRHTATAWSLFLAVDMPFVSTEFLGAWIQSVLRLPSARLALFTVDGVAQPTLCLVHRELVPLVERAVLRGESRVLPVLLGAAAELAAHSEAGLSGVLLHRAIADDGQFANVNTPDDLREAMERWAGMGERIQEDGG
jgi:molybdopterin-guanine dinucleotide biosynthesis protein A